MEIYLNNHITICLKVYNFYWRIHVTIGDNVTTTKKLQIRFKTDVIKKITKWRNYC